MKETNFDLIIVGGGVSGLSCALVIGSGLKKPFAKDKKVAIIAHQRSSHSQTALFNNALGITPGSLGKDVLKEGKKQLQELYPEVGIIESEKVRSIKRTNDNFTIATNKNTYSSKMVVIALNYSKPFTIKGLEEHLIPHERANEAKNRIQLRNKDHVVIDGLFACGTIAGWRSQFSIAAGSGAQVATDILTIWNNGKHTKIHDKPDVK